MEAPHCDVEDVSEHENHTSEESETSDYEDNIVSQNVHNVQNVQFKNQNRNWSLDPPACSGCLNSANFMKKTHRVTVYSTSRIRVVKSAFETVFMSTIQNYIIKNDNY
ncbi:hypothetical protein AVEN_197575-1 [Araneus ventricosus]|uniref:Uncharacterized protein n=1 Tax=Araneus ventricosus TaxID=182803 RepID=A0A4Y2SN94_ARAVE|nr:hypothetical protein AVEN_197575-1 [Araneus ventricosus]